MNIGKSNNNFKDKKLKCFNCNKYEHMIKKCWKKKEKKNKKIFQIQQRRAYHQRLQRKTIDEGTKDSKEIR